MKHFGLTTVVAAHTQGLTPEIPDSRLIIKLRFCGPQNCPASIILGSMPGRSVSEWMFLIVLADADATQSSRGNVLVATVTQPRDYGQP
jgi:hypothetical protein